jgi:hypothetical protein
VEAGVKAEDIAVVTPYNAQVRILPPPAHLTNFLHNPGTTCLMFLLRS